MDRGGRRGQREEAAMVRWSPRLWFAGEGKGIGANDLANLAVWALGADGRAGAAGRRQTCARLGFLAGRAAVFV